MNLSRVRDFIRLCKIRAQQDQYRDPDAFRKALHAVEVFAEGDEDRAVDIIQASGVDIDTSVWVRTPARKRAG